MCPEIHSPIPTEKKGKTPSEKGYRPSWKMVKQRILKEDGRYLIYYRFLPLPEEEIKEE